jgi:hypothetical protein
MPMRGMLTFFMVALAITFGGCGMFLSEEGVADTTPPLITNLQTRYVENNQLVVQAEVTDTGSGVAQVWVVRVGLGPEATELAMQSTGGNTYRVVISSPTARVRVKARDRAGNEALTDETRITPPPPPL